jgi:hypothetical protein
MKKPLMHNKYLFGLVAVLAILSAYADAWIQPCGFKWGG